MTLRVTPFCMSSALLVRDPLAMLSRENRHTVHVAGDYEERQTLEVDVKDGEAACERAWTVFQNIDENHSTPDDGRSLMVGDLVRVTTESGDESWWICCSMGWAETMAPNEDTMQIVER